MPSSCLLHYASTTPSLLHRYSFTTPSLLLHYSFTTLSLLFHYSFNASAVFGHFFCIKIGFTQMLIVSLHHDSKTLEGWCCINAKKTKKILHVSTILCTFAAQFPRKSVNIHPKFPWKSVKIGTQFPWKSVGIVCNKQIISKFSYSQGKQLFFYYQIIRLFLTKIIRNYPFIATNITKNWSNRFSLTYNYRIIIHIIFHSLTL